eukprot:gene5204-931_t
MPENSLLKRCSNKQCGIVLEYREKVCPRCHTPKMKKDKGGGKDDPFEFCWILLTCLLITLTLGFAGVFALMLTAG